MEEPRTSGLLNSRNNCYLNSVLQILARIPTIRDSLSTNADTDYGSQNISRILDGTLTKLCDGPLVPPFYPKDLMEWLKEQGNGHRFKEFEQSDPYELMELLVEKLGLTIFNHEEVSKTFCSACLDENTEFMASDLPGIGIRSTLDVSSGTSIQEVLEHYKETLTDSMCHRCGANAVIQREINVAPNVLMVSLERNLLINQNQMKNTTPCLANSCVLLKLRNGETVKYQLLGTINHIGSSVSDGHYVAKVKGIKKSAIYSDSYINVDTNNVGDVVLAFYLPENTHIEDEYQNPDVPMFMEEEVRQALGCNPDDSGNHPSDSNLEDISTSGPQDEINQAHLKTYVEAHATRDELQCLLTDRLLVIGLPKIDEMEELEDNDFLDRFDRFIFNEKDMIYTMTYKNSKFLKKILKDPILNSMYDFFGQEVTEKLGSKNEHEWIAEIGLCYIMHTHLHNKGPRYEFFFQLTNTAIFTHSILLYFHKVKQRVIDCLPKLKHQNLFCGTYCREECFVRNDSYHFSLSQMSALESSTNRHPYSMIHTWSFLDNEKQLQNHPLKTLLLPPEVEQDEDVLDALTRILNTFQINENRKWCTYILLVVKEFARVPSVENLKEIWDSRIATFGVYVGCTSTGRFRTDHLKTVEEGGKTTVSKFLDNCSYVFLVTSLPFTRKTDALNAEARLIGFLSYEKRMERKNKKTLWYKVLNINKEHVPMRQNTSQDTEAYKLFMESGQRLFRFIGEEVDPNWTKEGVLQSYLVKELIM